MATHLQPIHTVAPPAPSPPPHPLRRLLAINLVGNGVFLALILIARRLPDGPDPVPHAMVLTGIVIAVSATAFGLALIRRQARPEDGGND